ncbi:MAG: DUF4101 domain-containing protein, partial [Symploca sp. SIO2B6]|nr:DUF4101 domain-containing protein [Symploca sp. SIO2B6]
QDSRPSGYGNTALPTAERVSHLSPEGSLSHPNAQGNNDYALQPPQLTNVPHGTTISPRTRGQSGPRIDRLLLLAALGILGLLIMWMIASRIYSWISQTTQRPLLSGEQLEIQVNRPPVPITPLNPPLEASNVVEGELDESSAEKVIRTWLEAKKAAMGPSHDTSLLSDILVDGPLENWENRSATSKASNVYITYDYPELTIDEVVWSENTPDQAAVTVTISETSQVYQNDQLDVGQADDSPFSVTYNIIRDDGRWKIQSISTQ